MIVILSASGWYAAMAARKCAQSILVLRAVTLVMRLPARGSRAGNSASPTRWWTWPSTAWRAHKGTFHKPSAKYLHRYVAQFEGKHNIRDLDTVAQMCNVVTATIGKSLMYKTLIRN